MRKLLYILLLFGSIVQAQFSPMVGIIASQNNTPTSNYTLENISYDSKSMAMLTGDLVGQSATGVNVQNDMSWVITRDRQSEYTYSDTDITLWSQNTGDYGDAATAPSYAGGFRYTSDGTYGIGCRLNDYFYFLDTTTDWDITTTTTTASSSDLLYNGAIMRDCYIKPDDSMIFVANDHVGTTNVGVYAFTYTPSTKTVAVDTGNDLTFTTADGCDSLDISPDGKSLIIVDAAADLLIEYAMSTAWDLTTATWVREYDTTNEMGSPTMIRFNSDGSKLFVAVISNTTIYQYSLD